jgi:ubiquinone/menaquinone biosynthesis C-methylase UbiE
MTVQAAPSGDQARLWNGPSGLAWADQQALLDRLFHPFESLLAEAVAASGATSVLDVGCGTGATTLAIARRIGADADCVGIDISEPMLAVARTRAEREDVPARFIRADAQHHVFDAEGFDALVSRFGVMFFSDPVDAFGRLRQAMRPDGEMHCIAWRGPQENPFMTTAERAAAPLLPSLPARRPDGPGQFSFADPQRVHQILEESGWTDIAIEPLDVACAMPESDLVPYLTRLGPVGALLQQVDGCLRKRIIEVVRDAFAPYLHDGEVRFTAACWRIGARANATKAVCHA